MSAMHYVGAIIVLILITAVGIYSGKKVSSAGDFATGGRKAGVGIVAGSIIGTLVGGSSTIGTAQLAFKFGFSAWWFTLGGGIAVFILGLVFAKPFYQSGISTLPQVFTKEYDQNSSTIATVLMSIGSFLSIVAQLLSGIALITAASQLSSAAATILIVFLMLAYVVFGGVWGAGMVGIVKTILLYATVIVCGVLAINMGGGVSYFRSVLPHSQYFNLLARGTFVDLGAGISLILGVTTTQAYIQAIISAKSLRISKIGTFVAAFMIPVIGIGGIFVGMYMKIHFPEMNAATAFPTFVLNYLPPVVGGAILATLLVALVGTGAGISLGLSAMICNDIYKIYFNKNASDKTTLKASRIIIALILGGAALFTTGNLGSLIIGWSFMSMGLRGAVSFAPQVCALFLPGKIRKFFAYCAFIMGPLFVLVGKFILPENIDPLFLGVGVSMLVMFAGYLVGPKKEMAQS